MNKKTDTKILAEAMDVLAREIQSGDGVANAAIQEAANRLREQATDLAARDALLADLRTFLPRAIAMGEAHESVDGAPPVEYLAEARALLARTPKDAGAEVERLRKEAKDALHERDCCHEIYDAIRRALGYPDGTGYPMLAPEVAKVVAERDALRAIFPRVLEALGSGACAADCSLEFLSEIPREVGLVVGKLRAQLATAEADIKRLNELGEAWAVDARDYHEKLETAEAQFASAEEEAESREKKINELVDMAHAERKAREAADARVRELEDAIRKADSVRALYEDSEARLAAVLGAADAMRSRFAELVSFFTEHSHPSALHEDYAVLSVYDAARSANASESAPKIDKSAQRGDAVDTSGAGMDAAALIADKERLDWLTKFASQPIHATKLFFHNSEDMGYSAENGDKPVSISVLPFGSHHPDVEGKGVNLRAAIDAARNAGALQTDGGAL